jgi:hypothetical protein
MPTESELVKEIQSLVEKKRNLEYSTKQEKRMLTDELEAKRLQLQEIIVRGE